MQGNDPGFEAAHDHPASQFGVDQNENERCQTPPPDRGPAPAEPEGEHTDCQGQEADRQRTQAVDVFDPGVHRIEFPTKGLARDALRIPAVARGFAAKLLEINFLKIDLLDLGGGHQLPPASRPVRTAEPGTGGPYDRADKEQQEDRNEGRKGQLLKSLHEQVQLAGLPCENPAKPDHCDDPPSGTASSGRATSPAASTASLSSCSSAPSSGFSLLMAIASQRNS